MFALAEFEKCSFGSLLLLAKPFLWSWNKQLAGRDCLKTHHNSVSKKDQQINTSFLRPFNLSKLLFEDFKETIMHTDYPKLRSIEEWIRPNIGLISELFQSISPQCSKLGCISLRSHFKPKLKPSLSMKILSINNFTIKLLSKLLSDLFIAVYLKR